MTTLFLFQTPLVFPNTYHLSITMYIALQTKQISLPLNSQTLKNQNLTLLYKMVNDLTPQYLSSLVPSAVNETSRYNLRNSNDIKTGYTRTSQYYNSFLPFTIREWNALPEGQRNSSTVASFKFHLNQPSTSIPKFYYVGERRSQVLHTCLRTKCSSLNYDIYLRILTVSPLCRCGKIENSEHYLLQCRLCHQPRIEILQYLSQICYVSVDVLLFW